MEEIEIITSFWRYPEGGGQREEFRAGFIVQATAADAEQWVSKGLARRVSAPATPAPYTAPTE